MRSLIDTFNYSQYLARWETNSPAKFSAFFLHFRLSSGAGDAASGCALNVISGDTSSSTSSAASNCHLGTFRSSQESVLTLPSLRRRCDRKLFGFRWESTSATERVHSSNVIRSAAQGNKGTSASVCCLAELFSVCKS